MFKVHSMKRFDAGGGLNQEIQLNSFAIRKQVDVKRLKHQLWATMEKKFESQQNNQVGRDDVEMRNEENIIIGNEMDSSNNNPLTAVGMLGDMYADRILDPQNVSVQSSFICMLHLANEKGLKFEQPNTFLNGDAGQQTLAESDFTIM